MKEKIENFWKTYQMVNEWIRFSDTKAGVIVTIYGLIFTIIYSNSSEVYLYLASSIFVTVLTIISVILSVSSIYFAFKCLNPRLKNLNPKSIFYFGHIATHKNFKEYLDYSNQIYANDVHLIEQLAEQVFINSTIAWKKFKNVAISIRFFFVSLAFLISIIIIYFLTH